MNNLKKKDFLYIALIILAFIAMVLIITNNVYLYGSTLDWYGEHIAIPEYFRTLFYSTKDLFPDFAANIGSGQNIYNLSYYGFLSPIILISYLLPKVPMPTYIAISTIVCVIISTIMIYIFLKNKKYSSEVCFLSSLLFIMSSSISLHSHRHIMFINYMPFLILGLFGVDKKFSSNKSWLLTISSFFMIMTSYYFSIGGLACLFVYALYKYLKQMNKVTTSSFFKTFLSILVPILVAILMSTIITLPTLATLVNNRAPSNVTISIKDILIPNINTTNLLYDSYGLGLTAIVVFALINTFKKDKAHIILGILLTSIIIFNLFNYILNGTMYIDSKSLIPFLPLYIYIIAEFINDTFTKKLDWKSLIPSITIITILVILKKDDYLRYIIDLATIILSLLLFYKWNKKVLFITPIVIFTLIHAYAINANDELVLKYTAQENENLIRDSINQITEMDDTMYRISNELNASEYSDRIFNNINYYNGTIYSSVSNQLYNAFYYDTLLNNIATRNRALTISTPNLLSLMLTGNKYVISRNNPLHGYELVSTNSGLNIYKNENVLPYGFSTANVMSYEDFNKLSDQVKQEALLNVIVADTKTNNDFIPNTQKIDLNYHEILKNENVKTEADGSLSINVKDKLKIVYELPKEYQNKILFIRFKMNKKSPSKDLSIKINSVKNKLTASTWKYYNGNEIFDYVLASKEQTKLVFSFTEGIYNISDFETYFLDYAYIENSANRLSRFLIDKEKTKGDEIVGQINVPEDGYFMATIPYDNGFTIKVDSKPVEYEKVDTAYIGFKIKEGNHNISIEYEAPMKKISTIIASFGFIVFIIITFLESKRRI